MTHNDIMVHSLVVEAQALLTEVDAMRCANIGAAIRRDSLPPYSEDDFRRIADRMHGISQELHGRSNQ